MLTINSILGQHSLLGKGGIENYNEEIEKFFSWVAPFVEGEPGDFIEYMRYEESQEPVLVYLTEGPSVKFV